MRSLLPLVALIGISSSFAVACSSGDSGGTDREVADVGEGGGGEECNFRGRSEGVCAAQTLDREGNCPEPEAFEAGDERTCDGLDNDCDGSVDEGCDEDGDGFCDAERIVADDAPEGVCPNGGGDCWDAPGSNRARNTFPGAAQRDSETGCLQDVDDDERGARAPSGPEAVESGTDACDDEPRAWNAESCSSCSDSDGDGFFSGCDTYLSQEEDCDDSDESVRPDASEACDGTDSDCDGSADAQDDDAREYCRDSEQTGWDESQCVQRDGDWCCTLEDGGVSC